MSWLLLLIFAKLGGVGFQQLFGPVGNGLQTAGEEPQGFGLVHKAQAADEAPVIIQPLHTVDDVFCLGEGEHPAGKAKRTISTEAMRSEPSGLRS